MLILSRRPGDAIVIDGGIRIVVLASGQRCVRLGIEAPTEIGIVREEVLARVENAQSEGRASTDGRPDGGKPSNGKSSNGKHADGGD